VCVDAAPVLIAAVRMTMIIIARKIDISIGSQFAVCAVVAALTALGVQNLTPDTPGAPPAGPTTS